MFAEGCSGRGTADRYTVECYGRMELFLHFPFLAHLYGVMLNELRTEATLYRQLFHRAFCWKQTGKAVRMSNSPAQIPKISLKYKSDSFIADLISPKKTAHYHFFV
jgi:hypothetical protein